MSFDEMDARLRVFEAAHDHRVLPDLWMIARLDGRDFTRLARETLACSAPFEESFRDVMTAVACHLMDCGFHTIYGYTHSDEVSVLLHRDEAVFGRQLARYASILAGEASAKMTSVLQRHAVFDCRISQLPSEERVADYFRWRSQHAQRCALRAHCYWLLRQQGATGAQATETLEGLSEVNKHELLAQNGIDFEALPAWERRGVGLYWGPERGTARRRLQTDYELPAGRHHIMLIDILMTRALDGGD
jgi:tRNA(His) guanylyltransferase